MSRVLMFWLALLFVFGGGMAGYWGWKGLGGSRGGVSGTHTAGELVSATHHEPPLTEFTLLDQQGRRVSSRDLIGHVWAGSFFFASCPSRCIDQNIKIQELDKRYGPRGLKLVSITCDPANDTPVVLAAYAAKFNAHPDRWYFLTGDLDYIRRIGRDMFQLAVGHQTHSDRVIVFDQTGKVRGHFSVFEPQQYVRMQKLLDELLATEAG